jgi:hypothetical protein
MRAVVFAAVARAVVELSLLAHPNFIIACKAKNAAIEFVNSPLVIVVAWQRA